MKHCDPGQYCYKTTYHPHATCEDCGAGTVSTGGKCHEYWGCSVCPAGKQMPTAGGTLCSDCPGGTYSDSGASSCNACEKGKSSVKGATSAETCYWYATKSLSFLHARAYACPPPCTYLHRRCPAGRYSNQPGTAACEACPEGKYLEQTGQTSAQTCSACPGGAWSPAGSGELS